VGTIHYLSPEMINGDINCDIWTIGVLMYEILTGCLPYKQSTDSGTIERFEYGDLELDNNKISDVLSQCRDLFHQFQVKRASSLEMK